MFSSGTVLHQRYELQRQLGRTGAGRETWVCFDRTYQELVILKLLAFSPQMKWDELKLFEREAKVLAGLSHPRIPRYRDYFDIEKSQGEGVPWFILVQDYIPGRSLQEFLDQGHHFSLEEVKAIAFSLLDILIYLHRLNPPVLHRDIKPSNLIWGEDGEIYLVDFGAVQSQASVTGVTFTIVGTGGYAPLEQFWGRAVPASDLYALGATLIHLCTGISPGDLPHHNSQLQFADKIQASPGWIAWLQRMTDMRLEVRFQDAQIAREALLHPDRLIAQEMAPALMNFPRPLQCRIVLESNPKHLFCHIPAGGWHSLANMKMSLMGCFMMYILFSLVLPLVSFLVMGIFGVLGSFSLENLILAILSGGILYGVLIWLFGESTELHFKNDGRHGVCIIERQVGQLRYGRRTFPLKHLMGIVVQDQSLGFTVRVHFQGQGVSLSRMLGGMMKESECLWLVQELQRWLLSTHESSPE